MDESTNIDLKQAMQDQKLSVIVPVYNEQENIPPLFDALCTTLDGFHYEVIFINDGSSDESLGVLETLAARDPEHVVLVDFRRNFGQTAAMAAGIDYSSGDIMIMIDADMQNDPADIPALLAKIHEGYDLVSGWRVHRKDTFITRTLPSRMANWLISVVTGVRLHDYGCSLKAYRREVLEGFRLYGEMHRFIPAYAGSVGARVTEIPVNHRPRLHGKANYGLERTLKVILDLVTVKFLISYGGKPIYLFGGFGFLVILLSFISLGYIGFRKIAYAESLVRSPLLLMSVMLFMLGMQSIMSGLIAELLARTYYESQSKPAYSVRRVVNAQSSKNENLEKNG